LFELETFDELLFERDDALLKSVDVGGGAESSSSPGLLV